MNTPGRGVDHSLPQRIYKQVEYLKTRGIRVGDAIGIVGPQLGTTRHTASAYYYAYRRKLASISHQPDQLPPHDDAAARRRRLSERVDVLEKLLRPYGLKTKD